MSAERSASHSCQSACSSSLRLGSDPCLCSDDAADQGLGNQPPTVDQQEQHDFQRQGDGDGGRDISRRIGRCSALARRIFLLTRLNLNHSPLAVMGKDAQIYDGFRNYSSATVDNGDVPLLSLVGVGVASKPNLSRPEKGVLFT